MPSKITPVSIEASINKKIDWHRRTIRMLEEGKRGTGIRASKEFTRDYPELDRHALGHEIVFVDNRLCWKANPIMRALRDSINYNHLWSSLINGTAKFSVLDLMQMYRDIGYSLNGYVEVWWKRYNFDNEAVIPLSEWK